MTLRNQHNDSVSGYQIRTLYRGLDRTVFSVLCLFTGVKNTADSSQPLRLYIALYRGIDYCIFGQLCNLAFVPCHAHDDHNRFQRMCYNWTWFSNINFSLNPVPCNFVLNGCDYNIDKICSVLGRV
jgi:hypothetical protein